MRELLQQALSLLASIPNERSEVRFIRGPTTNALCDLIRKELFRSKWHKVADGLPVVPEGQYVARFWIYDKYGHVSKLRLFAHDSKEHIEQACQSVTHYMPRQDDTPAPPEAS